MECSQFNQMVGKRGFSVYMMIGHRRKYALRRAREMLDRHFTIEDWLPVGFGWTGKFGGTLDRLLHHGALERCSKSLTFVARRRNGSDFRIQR